MKRAADGPGVAREVDAEDGAARIRVVGSGAARGVEAVGIIAAVPDRGPEGACSRREFRILGKLSVRTASRR